MKVHSNVDLITNSSSTTYTSATTETITAFRNLINTILKKAGSDKKCNDLYELELIISNDFKEEIREQLRDKDLMGDPEFFKNITPAESKLLTEWQNGIKKDQDINELIDRCIKDELIELDGGLVKEVRITEKETGKEVSESIVGSISAWEVCG